MSVIKTEHLTHTYSQGTSYEQAAVSDVNLEIEPGELIGVIGHTGSGKSTLIQHFNGLLRPTSGKIYVDGEDIWENPKEIRRIRFKVGLVFQYPEYQLFEDTVYKDIAFGPKNMGLSEEEIDRRVKEAALFVGLKPHHMEKSPFELSGGQKRRVADPGRADRRPGPQGQGTDFGSDPGVSSGAEKDHPAGIPQHGGCGQIHRKGAGYEPR